VAETLLRASATVPFFRLAAAGLAAAAARPFPLRPWASTTANISGPRE